MMEFVDCLNYLSAHETEIKLAITIGVSSIPLYVLYKDRKWFRNFDSYIEERRTLPDEELQKPGTLDKLLRKHSLL